MIQVVSCVGKPMLQTMSGFTVSGSVVNPSVPAMLMIASEAKNFTSTSVSTFNLSRTGFTCVWMQLEKTLSVTYLSVKSQ